MELPTGHTELSRDQRPINAIYWAAEGADWFEVGRNNITAIRAYDENGQMSHIPWLAVYRGDEIVVRVPAEQVSIHYGEPGPLF